MDYEELTNHEILILLGKRIKEYRLAERKSQKELAELSGVSCSTISHFEQGSADNITLKSFMSLLRAMGLIDEMEKLLPELPMPRDIAQKIEKMSVKRIKTKKHAE